MTDSATGFFGGYSDQITNQFNNQLQQMQIGVAGQEIKGLSLDNAQKAISLKQDQMMQQLTQARMKGQQQAGRQPTGQPSLQDMVGGAIGSTMETAADLIASGKWKEGIEMESKASTMIRNQSSIQRNEFSMQKDAITMEAKQFQSVATILGNVHSKEDWDATRMSYLNSGQPVSPQIKQVLQQPYSPELIQRLHETTMTAYQQSKLKIDKLDQESKARNRANEIENRNKQNSLDQIKAKARAAAEGRAEGAGGGSLAPKPSELSPFIKAITDQYPAMDEVEAPIMARDLFERTKALLKKNPALSGTEAMKAAYAQQKKDGVYMSEQMKTGGASPQYPVQLKTGMKPEDGKYYTDSSGKVARYNAGGMFTEPHWEPVDTGIDAATSDSEDAADAAERAAQDAQDRADEANDD